MSRPVFPAADRLPLVAAALLLGATAVLVGCDLTGKYNAKFQDSLQKAGLRATFDTKLFPTETDVTDAARQSVGVRLRLPSYFDASSKPLPPAEPRAQPPFVALPHLSFAYERSLDDNAGKALPAYLYIAAVPKAEQKADALQAALAQQIGAAFPGASWGDVQIPKPDGTSLTLKRLRVEGPQDFVANPQTNAIVKQDGRFDLYLIDGGAHHVLLGWRCPKGQGEKWQFAASEAAMGTVTISEPPPGADGKAARSAPAGCAFALPRLAAPHAAGKLGGSAAARLNPAQRPRVAGWGAVRRLPHALRRDSSVG